MREDADGAGVGRTRAALDTIGCSGANDAQTLLSLLSRFFQREKIYRPDDGSG